MDSVNHWIRYTGSPSTTPCFSVSINFTNCVVEHLGIVHVPKSWVPGIHAPKMLGFSEDALTQTDTLPAPIIVKPNCGGSTVATNKASTIQKLFTSIEEVHQNTSALTAKILELSVQFDEKIISDIPHYTDRPIVQEYIEGEEYTVGVRGPNANPEILPIMQIVNIKAELFDWQEKYESDGSNEIFAEHLSEHLRTELSHIKKSIHSLVVGVARIDYRVRGNEIFFLEVNTFPATTASFIPKMWQKPDEVWENSWKCYWLPKLGRDTRCHACIDHFSCLSIARRLQPDKYRSCQNNCLTSSEKMGGYSWDSLIQMGW